uniref:Uncharacterized protein n=2 Tax=Avena sativa TaxID=4498 RepID=A0ACD5ZQ38_AVESA
MAEPEARTTNLGSASSVFQFRVDYNQSKQLPIGEAVCSDLVSAGEHLWRVAFYPRGLSDEDNSKYTSIFLQHMSKSRSVNAMFDAFMMGRDGKPSKSYIQRICDTFEVQEDKEIHDTWGWYDFEKITVVEKKFLIEGHITFVCTIIVIDDSPIPVPPSDIGAHLGRLLEHTDGTDVSFVVEDEKFPAHRAVLAARSPVFRAQLFGSMAEATLSSIRLQDIAAATFKVMLRFIYTDELPREGEPGGTSTEMFQNLLAAADLYGLDRLKIICAHELWARVSVDT